MTATAAAEDRRCSLCGAGVDLVALRDGAAVRVGNDLVCPACIEQLPSDAQIRINQIRAMHGMRSTTYRLRRDRHPELVCYTFSTSAQLMRHRRALAAGELIDTPVLGERDSLPTTAGRQREPVGPPPRRLLLIASGVGLALALALAIVLLALPDDPTDVDRPLRPPPPPITQPTVAEQPPPELVRADFARNPLEAWPTARDRLPSDDPVLAAIADEITAIKTPHLDLATEAITRDEFIKATDLLGRIELDDHPLFAALRRREDGLRSLLAERIAEVERAAERERRRREAAAAEQAAAEQAAAATAADPAVPDTDNEQPSAPLVADGPIQRWSSAATDLLADRDPPPGWQQAGRTGLRLVGKGGSLARSLVLPAGRYRVWLYLRDPPATGTLNCRLGDQERRWTVPPGGSTGWYAIGDEPIVLADGGEVLCFLFAQDGAWEFSMIQIADARVEVDAGRGLPTIPWVGTEEAVALTEPPPPPVVRQVLRSDDEMEVLVRPSEDQLLQIKNAVPIDSVGETVWESVSIYRPNGWRPRENGPQQTRFHGMVLHTRPIDLSAGGFVIHCHPLREDRETLDLVAIDTMERTWPVATVTLENRWQTIACPLPGVPPPVKEGAPPIFDATAVTGLAILEGEAGRKDRLSTRFLVGKAVAVANKAPEPSDIGLDPQALLRLDDERLERTIRSLLDPRGRPDSTWPTWFDLRRMRVLYGHHLLPPDLRTDLRRTVADSLGMRSLPPNSAEKLVLQDLWLDGEFLIDAALLDAEHHHSVLVTTGGAEFLIGLTEDQALQNFWLKLVDECLARGMLPIVVLGPSKVPEQYQDACDRLWTRLRAHLTEHHPGVPMIDCSMVEAHNANRYADGAKDFFMAQLGRGLDDLVERVDRLAAEREARR